MKTRIITAVVALAVFLPFLIFSDTFAFVAMCMALSAIAVFEIVRCTGSHRNLFAVIPAILIALIMPLLTRTTMNGMSFQRYAYILFFTFTMYLLAVSLFSDEKFPVDRACTVAVMTMYASFGFSSLIMVRDYNNGIYIFPLAFLIPWMTDTFAYFIGRKFGKHKLIPKVSPKKTVEGAVAGAVFSCLAVLLYGVIISLLTDLTPKYFSLIIMGLLLSIVSQCGDLVASLLKRHYSVKDYGKILPGHGGIMDRFDSIIAVAPSIYILCSIFPVLELFF